MVHMYIHFKTRPLFLSAISIGCADFPPALMFRKLGSTFCTILVSSEMQMFASRREGTRKDGWGQKVLVDLCISNNSHYW